MGLRARLWVGCLASGLVAGAGIWWVIFEQTAPGAEPDTRRLVTILSVVAAAGFLAGVLALFWLDRGVVRQLRGLIYGMRTGRVTDLRGLPSSGGWGELSLLTEQVQVLLGYQRQALRSAEDLGALRRQLTRVQKVVAQWVLAERWAPFEVEPGPLEVLSQSLSRSAERLEELREENCEVALQVRDGLARAEEEVRGESEQAERGFVEATALLTTVRELQRLSAELGAALAEPRKSAGETPSDEDAWRRSCRAAIEELVAASTESVEHLARGLAQVQGISDQVQVLSNRATLVALNFALAATRPSESLSELGEVARDMKALAAEVRGAAESVQASSAEVEREVHAAAARMGEVRERVAERLDHAAPAVASRPREESVRLLERVREMVQDAGQKGERLVAAAERTSRGAERSLRALEESVSELDGLLVRLASGAPRPGATAAPAAPGSAELPAPLRLLTPEDVSPLDDQGESAGERGT